MFHLFKRSYSPRPIFSVLGTDMHCHLVPKVDDGSKCYEESIECLNTLKAVGYDKVIITPHFQTPRFWKPESMRYSPPMPANSISTPALAACCFKSS